MMPDRSKAYHRCGIVMRILDRAQAQEILRRMGEDADGILREMQSPQPVDDAERSDTLSEFVRACNRRVPSEFAAPFSSFHDEQTQSLLDSLRDEHPQTVALVLAHLPHDKSGEILAALEPAKRVEVVKHIAGIEQTSSQVIQQVEQGLRQRLGRIVDQTVRSGGVSAVAEILNSADRRTEREILLSLEHDAPELAEQIRKVQTILDDLLHADDRDIRLVLDQLDLETISLALRTSRERLVRKALLNMDAGDAERVERELRSVEPVTISEIESAQKRVAEVVERLRTCGEIDVPAPRGRRSQKGETV